MAAIETVVHYLAQDGNFGDVDEARDAIEDLIDERADDRAREIVRDTFAAVRSAAHEIDETLAIVGGNATGSDLGLLLKLLTTELAKIGAE